MKPICTEQGSAALMYKRMIELARKYSVCEEPERTEQGSAALMYKCIIVLAKKYSV